jgi:hypothetical protein
MENRNEKTTLIWVAIFFMLFTFIYFIAVTFITVPASAQHNSDLILGFLSSGIALVLGYYYGNSNRTIAGINDKNINNEETDKQQEDGDDPSDIDIANAQKNSQI